MDGGGNQRSDLRVTQLCLGLGLKLGVFKLDRHHGAKTFSHVLARQVAVRVLQHSDLAGVVVEDLGDARLEAHLVGTAVDGVHIVCKGDDGLVIAGIILHCHLGNGAVLFALHIDDLIVQGILVLLGVQILYEGANTSFKAEIVLSDKLGSFIAKDDAHACI